MFVQPLRSGGGGRDTQQSCETSDGLLGGSKRIGFCRAGGLRIDANTQKGVNVNGQVATPLAPFVSARYLVGANGEVPSVNGVSLRVGGPTAVTLGITSDGKITSVGVNQRFGIIGVGAYVGVRGAYQCP